MTPGYWQIITVCFVIGTLAFVLSVIQPWWSARRESRMDALERMQELDFETFKEMVERVRGRS